MKTHLTNTILCAVIWSFGCTPATEKGASSSESPVAPGVTKVRTAEPTELKKSVIKLNRKAAGRPSVEALSFVLKSPRPGLTVEGEVSDGLRWRDKLGENFVLFSRRAIAAPAKIETGDQGPGRALYATHYLLPTAGGPPIKKRVIKDRYESCGFDLSVRFLKASFKVTDLDDDGVGEATFAYVVDCASDVSPLTIKLLMLENGAKYILRGQSRVQIGQEEWSGGVFKVDESFKMAPTSFLIHAGNLWMTINTLQ